MKKIFIKINLLVFATFCHLTISAQTAPDFTETDINGNVHHLYSILDEGKAVLLDFSATWCPPCWTAHKAGTLKHIYEDYGPNGLDEVVVLFIEPDLNTNHACLEGDGANCTGGTQGNWIEGTPYPIIDLVSNSTSSAYGINSFPTFVLISPDRTIKKKYLGASFNLSELKAELIDALIPDPGTSSKVLSMTAQNFKCEQTAATFEVMNRGENLISKLTVEIKGNGTVLDIQELEVDIPSLSFKNINLDPFDMPQDEDVLLEIKVTAEGDMDASNDIASIEVSRAVGTDNFITMYIRGDENATADQTKYAVYNPNGEKIVQGDIKANQIIESTVWLNDLGCYKVELSENGFGDGLAFGEVNIRNSNGEKIYTKNFFGNKGGADFIADQVSSSDDTHHFIKNEYYPNPTSNELNIVVNDGMGLPATLVIVNQVGQKVWMQKIVDQHSKIDLNLNNGMYHIQMVGLHGLQSQTKMIISK